MFYFWGGGSVVNLTKFNPPPPKTSANANREVVAAARHFQSTVHHAFGYAFYLTGDATFKQMGDDVFEASFGDQVDGIHCLAASGKAKDYDMNYRASGRYLVWRLSHGSGNGQLASGQSGPQSIDQSAPQSIGSSAPYRMPPAGDSRESTAQLVSSAHCSPESVNRPREQGPDRNSHHPNRGRAARVPRRAETISPSESSSR